MQGALQAPEKRVKKVTKVALAKKILNKGIVAGQKVKFDDDGTPSDAADLALQAANAKESEGSDYEGMYLGGVSSSCVYMPKSELVFMDDMVDTGVGKKKTEIACSILVIEGRVMVADTSASWAAHADASPEYA